MINAATLLITKLFISFKMKVKSLIIGAFLMATSEAIKIRDDDDYDFYSQGNIDKDLEKVAEA